MTAIVRIMEDRVVADSRDVAADFGKQHKNVMRMIDGIEKDAPELRLNFEPQLFPVLQGNGAQRHYRRFDMDRKGFMLLVMGFTGAKALAIKSAWIDAFDRMERMLTEVEPPAIDRPQSSPFVDVREKLLFVREARTLGGRAAGRRAWAIAELPDVFDDAAGRTMLSDFDADPVFSQWLAERTERFDGRTQATLLYDDYVRWCGGNGLSPRTMKAFSAQLLGHGYPSRKSGIILYQGLRLRAPS